MNIYPRMRSSEKFQPHKIFLIPYLMVPPPKTLQLVFHYRMQCQNLEV